MAPKTKRQLQKLVRDGYDARNELQAREDAESNKRNKWLVGTCQKYKNSYGAGGGEDWWLYRRIVSIDGKWCKAFSFQTDCHGKVEIRPDDQGFLDRDSWLHITEDEWVTAYQAMHEHVLKQYQRAAVNGTDE